VNSKYVVGHRTFFNAIYGGRELREYQSKNPDPERLQN
jgi:hypothetical protein